MGAGRLALLLLAIVALTNCAGGRVGADPRTCLESAYGAALVRIDEPNQRAFVVWEAAATPILDAMAAYVGRAEPCMAGTPWAEGYAVSVFSAPQYAGYMTEPDILPLVKSGAWESAYLAEFDRASRVVTLHPVTAPEEIRIAF